MEQTERKGRTRAQEEWRQRLVRQEASGTGVEAFCRAESVSVGSFYRWRRRLSEGAEQPRSPAGGDPSGTFFDLGTLARGSGRWELELALGGGLTLRLRGWLMFIPEGWVRVFLIWLDYPGHTTSNEIIREVEVVC